MKKIVFITALLVLTTLMYGQSKFPNSAIIGEGGIKFCAPIGEYPAYTALSEATAANQLFVAHFYLPYSITVTKIGVAITTGASGDSINVGIYNSAGTTKIIDSGIISATSTGWIKANVNNVLLTPGFYWCAYSNTNNAIRVRGYNNDGIAGVGNDAAIMGLSNASTYKGVLPATIGSSITGGNQNGPFVILSTY